MATRRLFDYKRVPQKERALILACMLFWSVLCYLGVSNYILCGMRVEGDSMSPTLAHGDQLALNRFIYRLRPPRRGEIVTVKVPSIEGGSVKRVVALPGETLQIDDGVVYINGEPLSEPYLSEAVVTDPGAIGTAIYELPPGCYFVLGDNRDDSMDSRSFGGVRRPWVTGRVILREGKAAGREMLSHRPSGDTLPPG